jgi:hypothetical protein
MLRHSCIASSQAASRAGAWATRTGHLHPPGGRAGPTGRPDGALRQPTRCRKAASRGRPPRATAPAAATCTDSPVRCRLRPSRQCQCQCHGGRASRRVARAGSAGKRHREHPRPGAGPFSCHGRDADARRHRARRLPARRYPAAHRPARRPSADARAARPRGAHVRWHTVGGAAGRGGSRLQGLELRAPGGQRPGPRPGMGGWTPSRIDIGTSFGGGWPDREGFLAHSAGTEQLFSTLFEGMSDPVETLYECCAALTANTGQRVMVAEEAADGRRYGPAIFRVRQHTTCHSHRLYGHSASAAFAKLAG